MPKRKKKEPKTELQKRIDAEALPIPKFLDRRRWTKKQRERSDAAWKKVEEERLAAAREREAKALAAARTRAEEKRKLEAAAAAKAEETQARKERVGKRKGDDNDVYNAIAFDSAKTVTEIMEKTGITENWDVRRALQRLKKAGKVVKHPDNRLWWKAVT